MTKSEVTRKCSTCAARKAKKNPIKGVLIPLDGIYGKCTRKGGLCDEIKQALKDSAIQEPS